MNVIVVIPTYNERDNIGSLVPAILAQGPFDVLVVDDASPDGTGALADQLAAANPGRVHVIHRTGRKGFGRSYVDGFDYALQSTQADLICQMDADFSHDPKYLPDLVAAAQAGADVVIGSRYLNGVSVVNWPLRRLFLSTFANWYVRTITGIGLKDCTGGYRCWRRPLLTGLHPASITSDGYSFQVEALFKAAHLRAAMREVPIVFVERRQGASKMTGRVLFESMFMPWRLILFHGGRPPAARAAS
jgi:dolichol-phosphate mannosyltransferase